MIAFIEHSGGYRERTIDNSFADLTIAFAMDFTTAGEVLTKKSAMENGRYLPINVANAGISDEEFKERIGMITDALRGVKSLNVAGNGLYTLKKYGFRSQEDVDLTCKLYLGAAIHSLKEQGDFKLTLIRSGGQSGFDEAGLKVGLALDIPTLCLAPKGWRFRDGDGNDIYDEKLFKQRFKNGNNS